ncbi:MAG: hypothetical protein ABIO57_02615 [Candidatus Paceibacterota bacterium]
METTQSMPKAPARWAHLPTWFKESEWLLVNQNSQLVTKLEAAISQIDTDQAMRKPHPHFAPMEATLNSDAGSIGVNATKRAYTLVIKEVDAYEGMDAAHAQTVLKMFKEEYKEYIPYLV